jgi:hypothetical protein
MDKKTLFQAVPILILVLLAFVVLFIPHIIYNEPIINVYINTESNITFFYLRCDLIQTTFVDYSLFKECHTNTFITTPECFNVNYMKSIYMPGSIDCSSTNYLHKTYNKIDSLSINYCAFVFWVFIGIALLIIMIPLIIKFINKKRKERKKHKELPSYNIDVLVKLLWENEEYIDPESENWKHLRLLEQQATLDKTAKAIDLFGIKLHEILQNKRTKAFEL